MTYHKQPSAAETWRSYGLPVVAFEAYFVLLACSLSTPTMAFLRRRFLGDSAEHKDSRTPSPADLDRHRKGSHVTIPAKKLEELNAHVTKQSKRRGSKRRNVWIFGLGGLFGIIIAGFFAQSQEMIDLSHLADMNLDSFADILPAGLLNEARAMQVSATRGYLCIHPGFPVQPRVLTPVWKNTKAYTFHALVEIQS